MKSGSARLLACFAVAAAVGAAQTQVVGYLPGCGGVSLAVTDDWDGDGLADVVRSCSGGQTVVVVSSSTGATLASLAVFPLAVTIYGTVADLDQDGHREVVLGNPGLPPLLPPPSSVPGWIAAYSFASPAAPLWQRGPTGTAGGYRGFAVVGDIDTDGVEDLAAGQPGGGLDCPDFYTGSFPFAGVLEILSGASGSVLRTHTSAVGEPWPASVATPGDVTGDGIPDYVVAGAGRPAPLVPYCLPAGTPLPAMPSTLTAFSGAPGGGVHWSLAGPPTSGAFVNAIGDFDSDMDVDLLVVGNLLPGPIGYEAVVDAGSGSTLLSFAFPGTSLPLNGTSVGDLNGDFASEVVTGDQFGAVVRAGGTGIALYSMPSVLPAPIAIADFDGDGRVDFAMSVASGQSAESIILSLGAACPQASAAWSGTGCGAGGPVPGLVLSGPPYFGWNRTLAYVNGPPLAPAFVFLGLPGSPIPLGGGCNVQIDLSQPFSLVWAPTLDAGGTASAVFTVPVVPGLAGAQMRLQGSHIAPAGAVALTASIDLAFGF